MASDFSLLNGTSFLTSFSSRATKTLRHNMGGGNNPFSFVERREEEDPEVRSFLFFSSLFSIRRRRKIYTTLCVLRIQMPLSLSAPAGKEDRIGNRLTRFHPLSLSLECNTQTAPPTHVTTVDETLESTVFARSLCHRAYVLGFFCLPCVWGAAAYYFSPPKTKKGASSIRRDAVVDRYVHKMRRGSMAWLCAAGTWTVAWYLVGPETTVLHVPGWFWVE